MSRDELNQALRYSEDVRAFGTVEEQEIVFGNVSAYQQAVTILNEVVSAPNPLPDELRDRLRQACEAIDALFPLEESMATSVSVIVTCARRCLSGEIS